MRRRESVFVLLSIIILCGCSMQNENRTEQSQQREIDEEASINAEDVHREAESDIQVEDEDQEEKKAPMKEEVLATRAEVLEGMSEAEIERLTENIKVANLCMESAYLNDNIFEKLEDGESLYWKCFDEKGEIQVGWEYNGDRQEMKEIMDQEGLSVEEFCAMYGTPVTMYNRFDAESFIDLIEEMKSSVKNEKLQKDLQQIIDETGSAADTREVEHAYRVYQLLHDMDYYLLRYGVEDVGKYVQDISTVSRYYGVLTVYN